MSTAEQWSTFDRAEAFELTDEVREERRALVDTIADLGENAGFAERDAVAGLMDEALEETDGIGNPTERWRAVTENLGFEDSQRELDAAWNTSAVADALDELEELADEVRDMGLSVSIGRPDPTADFSIVTPAALAQRATDHLTQTEEELASDLSRGDLGASLFTEPTEIPGQLSARSRLQQAVRDTMSDETVGELRTAIGTLGAVARGEQQPEGKVVIGEQHALIKRMGNLDKVVQFDTESIGGNDAERGANRYNNRPPEVDPDASYHQNAATYGRYMQARLELFRADRSDEMTDAESEAADGAPVKLSRLARDVTDKLTSHLELNENSDLPQVSQAGDRWLIDALKDDFASDRASDLTRTTDGEKKMTGYQLRDLEDAVGQLNSSDRPAIRDAAETEELFAWLDARGDPDERRGDRHQLLEILDGRSTSDQEVLDTLEELGWEIGSANTRLQGQLWNAGQSLDDSKEITHLHALETAIDSEVSHATGQTGNRNYRSDRTIDYTRDGDLTPEGRTRLEAIRDAVAQMPRVR